MCLNLAFNETPYTFPYSEETVTRVVLLDPNQGKVYSEQADCLSLPEFGGLVATRYVAKQIYQQDHIFQNPACYQELGEQGSVRYLSTLVDSSAYSNQERWISVDDVAARTVQAGSVDREMLETIVRSIN